MDEVHVATVADSDGWQCCVPVRRSRTWRRLPVPATLAWRHPQCLLGTPLVARGAPESPLEALLEGLRRQARGGLFELDWTDEEGAVGSRMKQALPAAAIVFGRFSRAALFRRPEPTYLEGRLQGKHRRSLRRLAGQLAERLDGDLTLVDRTHEPGAVDRFLELEAAGWKGRRGTALASTPAATGFFREMIDGFAERGAVELLFLEVGDRIVAARCNLRGSDVIFCYKVAHDEELRSFSPGTQLELLMIDRFHADASAARMDCCADRNSELFNRLWPDRRHLTGVLLLTSGLRGAAAWPIARAGASYMDRRRAPVAAAGGP
jgi:hypothetical protein